MVTRRRGREKLHFLNPVPIRLIHDRWVSKYAEPWVAGLSEIKERLESQMEKVYEIFIKTTPERLWEAIIDPDIRAKYNFGAAVYSDWKVGAPISVDVTKHDVHLGEGEVLEVDPPRRLVHTMAALWDDDVKAEGVSRVTWEIEPVGDDSCHLTLTHDQMREGANSQIYGGWPMILSGLKTWLESGEELTTPGSLRYAEGDHAPTLVIEFVTLDGVMQGLGSPDEDRDGGFAHGGGPRPMATTSNRRRRSRGCRRRPPICSGGAPTRRCWRFWPQQPDANPMAAHLNATPKYVATRTLEDAQLTWANAKVLRGDLEPGCAQLKAEGDGSIAVLGSGVLVQELAALDLVNGYRLFLHPLLLGRASACSANSNLRCRHGPCSCWRRDHQYRRRDAQLPCQ